MKRISKFLKSKKGNYAIFAIVLIPVILSFVTTIVSAQRNKTVYESEIKTSISSFFEYENEYNSTVTIEKNKEGVESYFCSYTPEQRQKIKDDFKIFFTQIDGYNKFWYYNEIEYKSDNDEGKNFSIAFKCVCYIPKINTLKVIDYWGIDYGNYKTTDGYYQLHPNTMASLYEQAGSNGQNVGAGGIMEGTEATPVYINNKYWQKIVIEVNSSCV